MAMSELQWMDIFADNLREILRDTRMTQRELADATGLSESTISKYLHKQQMPSLKAIINIYHAVDCDFDEILYFGDRLQM